MKTRVEYRWNAIQLQGRRARQEDAYVVRRMETFGHWLFAVGDGLGGHDNGDWAAQFATRQVVECITRADDGSQPLRFQRQTWKQAFVDTDAALRKTVVRTHRRYPPASTLIVVQLDETGHCSMAGVGDSLLLHVHRNGVRELLRRQGNGNIVHHAIGFGLQQDEAVQTETLALEVGDRLVLATDGIDVLEPDDLKILLSLPFNQALAGLSTAITAIDHPAQDNVTVVLVDVTALLSDESRT